MCTEPDLTVECTNRGKLSGQYRNMLSVAQFQDLGPAIVPTSIPGEDSSSRSAKQGPLERPEESTTRDPNRDPIPNVAEQNDDCFAELFVGGIPDVRLWVMVCWDSWQSGSRSNLHRAGQSPTLVTCCARHGSPTRTHTHTTTEQARKYTNKQQQQQANKETSNQTNKQTNSQPTNQPTKQVKKQTQQIKNQTNQTLTKHRCHPQGLITLYDRAGGFRVLRV